MGRFDKLKSKFNEAIGVSEEDISSISKGKEFQGESSQADDNKNKNKVKKAKYKDSQDYLKQRKSGKILALTFKSTLITLTGTIIAFTFSSVIDGIIIGQFLDANCIAAAGLSSSFFMVMLAVSEVFSAGTQSRCANFMGKGDMKSANSIFNTSMILSFCCGVIILLASAFLQDPIATMTGANTSNEQMTEVYNAVKAYVFGLGLGGPIYLLFTLLQPFMQLDGDRKRVVPATIICSCVNIAGDLFNVFFLGWGMFGMGLATSLGYLAGLLYLLPHFWSPKAHYSLSIKAFSLKNYLGVLTAGLPKIVSRILIIVRTILINSLLLSIAGSVGVASLSIQGNAYGVFGCVIIALGSTTMLLSNIYFGEQDKTGLVQLLRSAFKVGFLVIVIMVILIIVAPFFAAISTSDQQVIECATTCIRITALAMPISAINLALENFAQGTGKIRITYAFLILQNFLLVLGIAFALSPLLGLNGVWLSYVLNCPVMLIIYLVFVMIKKKKVKITIEDIMLLPDNFDVDKKQKFEYAITDMEDVMMASVSAEVLCMRNNIDTKRTNLTSLCIEEMAKNIVEHGIKDQNKQRVDIKVIVTYTDKEDGQITIRMRDNCLAFNPVDHHKEMDLENPMEGIGIRMVFKIASDVTYISTMNLNNLIIKL